MIKLLCVSVQSLGSITVFKNVYTPASVWTHYSQFVHLVSFQVLPMGYVSSCIIIHIFSNNLGIQDLTHIVYICMYEGLDCIRKTAVAYYGRIVFPHSLLIQ